MFRRQTMYLRSQRNVTIFQFKTDSGISSLEQLQKKAAQTPDRLFFTNTELLKHKSSNNLFIQDCSQKRLTKLNSKTSRNRKTKRYSTRFRSVLHRGDGSLSSYKESDTEDVEIIKRKDRNKSCRIRDRKIRPYSLEGFERAKVSGNTFTLNKSNVSVYDKLAESLAIGNKLSSKPRGQTEINNRTNVSNLDFDNCSFRIINHPNRISSFISEYKPNAVIFDSQLKQTVEITRRIKCNPNSDFL
ncbi:hypothetical protein GJ496_008620 [Pomphorhynchus laevis]|nr:hypothetical protein GJ496_008620 [Pomphorhynchus laevis]